MKTIILYDTCFGNTERIAKSLETGLKEAAADIQDVVCINAKDKLLLNRYNITFLRCYLDFMLSTCNDV